MARSRNSRHARYGHLKQSFFSTLEGVVLELGPGAGDNLRYYPKNIQLIGLEPNAHMHPYLLAESARTGVSIDIRPMSALEIGLDNESVDCAVSTLVLCSVTDPAAVLGEILRVLKPQGRFVFIEHVAAPEGTLLLKLQRVLRKPWHHVADGCDPQRRTWEFLERSGFKHVDYRHCRISPRLSFAPGRVIAPHIVGIATKG